MTRSFTYQELQQLAADKLHLNVELNPLCDNIIELTLPCIINEYGYMHIGITMILELSVCGDNLFVDYKRIMPTDNMQNGLLLDLIDSFNINVFNSADCSLYECFLYAEIIEKMPDVDRLCIHLAAIPHLQTILQQIEIDSVVTSFYDVQIIAHIKN